MIRREGDPLWALPGERKGLDVGAIAVVDEPHDVPAHVGYDDEVTILDDEDAVGPLEPGESRADVTAFGFNDRDEPLGV